MTGRSSRRPAERATDREVGVVAAVLIVGSEKAAAHHLGLSHSTVKHHLANARSKVGAEATAQLVRILASLLRIPRVWAIPTISGRPCAPNPTHNPNSEARTQARWPRPSGPLSN